MVDLLIMGVLAHSWRPLTGRLSTQARIGALMERLSTQVLKGSLGKPNLRGDWACQPNGGQGIPNLREGWAGNASGASATTYSKGPCIQTRGASLLTRGPQDKAFSQEVRLRS